MSVVRYICIMNISPGYILTSLFLTVFWRAYINNIDKVQSIIFSFLVGAFVSIVIMEMKAYILCQLYVQVYKPSGIHFFVAVVEPRCRGQGLTLFACIPNSFSHWTPPFNQKKKKLWFSCSVHIYKNCTSNNHAPVLTSRMSQLVWVQSWIIDALEAAQSEILTQRIFISVRILLLPYYFTPPKFVFTSFHKNNSISSVKHFNWIYQNINNNVSPSSKYTFKSRLLIPWISQLTWQLS